MIRHITFWIMGERHTIKSRSTDTATRTYIVEKRIKKGVRRQSRMPDNQTRLNSEVLADAPARNISEERDYRRRGTWDVVKYQVRRNGKASLETVQAGQSDD